jgi:putative sigma-54 modulation protein
MQLQLTGHQLEITPAIRDFVEKKLQKIRSLGDRITHIHVTLEKEKVNAIALANISLPGSQFHVESRSEDMYESIDKLVDKIVHQLKKYKDKNK